MAPFLDEGEDLVKGDLPLHPVAVDSWGGFLFVRLEPGPSNESRSLAAQLGEAPGRVVRYPLADLRTARRLVYDVAANWKVMLENYNECYHCAGVHPELCEVVPAFKYRGGAALDWERGIPASAGGLDFHRLGDDRRGRRSRG